MTSNTYFRITLSVVLVCLVFVLSACGGGGSGDGSVVSTPAPVQEPPSVTISDELIKVNQLGYLPALSKVAIVPNTDQSAFQILDAQTETVVYTGELSSVSTWAPASQSIKQADFSDFVDQGEYKIQIEGFEDSFSFQIGNEVYDKLHDGVLKAYYFNRASTELSAAYAGEWLRPLGHPDTSVLVHASAASNERPEGTVISSTKGWYDAGDYNKYIVNSGISTYTLLAAYSQHPAFYQNKDINIPESGDALPDILDEIKWNIDWILSMQDPNDGGVYHKLTSLGFSGTVMPHEANSQRYVVQKGTAASLNFAAVMAKASRVFAEFPEYASLVEEYKNAAISAYAWAQANPNIEFINPSDVSTGEYGDASFADEFAWAAAELFLLSQEETYLNDFNQYSNAPGVPFWQNTMALAYFSLLHEGQALMSADEWQSIRDAITNLADSIVSSHNNSAYKVAMEDNDFVWGSNSTATNKAMILMQAYAIVDENQYIDAATGLIDYVLGKNPTDYSFVTGFGENTPLDPHHRQSFADQVVAPVPGFVVGGPQPGQQDNCAYPSNLPSLSYLDDWCSYSTNEVTINWNAPMVFVLAALISQQ